MAKKQGRYYQADMEKALPQLLGEHVSLILEDGQVHYVKLVRLDHDQLIATDGLQRIHRFPRRIIAEIIEEKHA